MSNVNAKIENIVSENADLRAQMQALIDATARTNETVATLAAAALAPRARGTRTAKAPVQMSREESLAASCGFNKIGPRRSLFLALVALPSGNYPLADFAGATVGDAKIIARRLDGVHSDGTARNAGARSDAAGFSLVVDDTTRGATVLMLSRKEKEEEVEA
jgi:hypothetical protein